MPTTVSKILTAMDAKAAKGNWVSPRIFALFALSAVESLDGSSAQISEPALDITCRKAMLPWMSPFTCLAEATPC